MNDLGSPAFEELRCEPRKGSTWSVHQNQRTGLPLTPTCGGSSPGKVGLPDTHSRLIACIHQSDCTLSRTGENHRAPVWCPGTSLGLFSFRLSTVASAPHPEGPPPRPFLEGLQKSPVPSATAPVKLAPGSRPCAPVRGSAWMSHSSLPAQAGKMETQSAESLQGLS